VYLICICIASVIRFLVKKINQILSSQPCPLAGANAKDDLLSKMSFWILQG